MMNTGNKILKGLGYTQVSLSFTGEFKIYGLYEGERVEILAPNNINDRAAKLTLRTLNSIEIICGKSVDWTYDLKPMSDGKEYPDPRPVELTIAANRPLTLREEMQRFIRTEVSLATELAGGTSFESEDDFDVEDDFPTSEYELTEMQEEYYDDGNPSLQPESTDTGETSSESNQAPVAPAKPEESAKP